MFEHYEALTHLLPKVAAKVGGSLPDILGILTIFTHYTYFFLQSQTCSFQFYMKPPSLYQPPDGSIIHFMLLGSYRNEHILPRF